MATAKKRGRPRKVKRRRHGVRAPEVIGEERRELEAAMKVAPNTRSIAVFDGREGAEFCPNCKGWSLQYVTLLSGFLGEAHATQLGVRCQCCPYELGEGKMSGCVIPAIALVIFETEDDG